MSLGEAVGRRAAVDDPTHAGRLSWTALRRVARSRLLQGVALPLALLALWWILAAAGRLPPQILPHPARVWESVVELTGNGQLSEHVLVSLKRVLVGFFAGAAFGLVFGALAGLSPTFRAFAYPPVQAVSRVNVLAWMPLLTLFLGIDEALKYVVIAWSASVPVMLGTVRGFAEIPAALHELGAAFVFRARDRLRLIVLPAALPSIFTGLREGMANAWQAMVIAELFASFEGVGYLMAWGRQLFQLDLVILGMVIVSLLGLVLDQGLKWLATRAQPWNAKRGGHHD